MNVYCWYCLHEYVLFITFLVVIAFQMAGVQFVFIIQMGLSAVGINVVYCEVTVSHFTYMHNLLLVLFQAVLTSGCI